MFKPLSPPLDSDALFLDEPLFFDQSTCVAKGFCPVTSLKVDGAVGTIESHSIYYEQHGRGTKYKLVFIMGLNASCYGWGPQIEHFRKSEDFTALVFDNRGVGNSGYPKGNYSTLAMAEDIVALLQHVGWTEPKELHVVGVSLGGMIAQELAWRIPGRIASLVLGATKPGGRAWNNIPNYTALARISRGMFASPEEKAQLAMATLFTKPWLDLIDPNDPQKRTNREVQIEAHLHRTALTKPQLLSGHISQITAALGHYTSPSRLAFISACIPKITIVAGEDDAMVPIRLSKSLKACMPEAELVILPDTAHGLHLQRAEQFNALVERTVKEAIEKMEKGWTTGAKL